MPPDTEGAGDESSGDALHLLSIEKLAIPADFFYNVEQIGVCMSNPTVGEFERAVLLAVIRLGDEAYGVRIRDHLEEALGRRISFGAVYTTLDRLLEKGLVSARVGDPTPQRGGRAKKFFTVLAPGRRALERARETSEAIWSISPIRSLK
jgi:PadR family transcriptional regulator PadR